MKHVVPGLFILIMFMGCVTNSLKVVPTTIETNYDYLAGEKYPTKIQHFKVGADTSYFVGTVSLDEIAFGKVLLGWEDKLQESLLLNKVVYLIFEDSTKQRVSGIVWYKSGTMYGASNSYGHDVDFEILKKLFEYYEQDSKGGTLRIDLATFKKRFKEVNKDTSVEWFAGESYQTTVYEYETLDGKDSFSLSVVDMSLKEHDDYKAYIIEEQLSGDTRYYYGDGRYNDLSLFKIYDSATGKIGFVMWCAGGQTYIITDKYGHPFDEEKMYAYISFVLSQFGS